jgi:hypothetical protein
MIIFIANWLLPWRTEKNHLSQNSRYPSQDSNWVSFEYKSKALAFEPISKIKDNIKMGFSFI